MRRLRSLVRLNPSKAEAAHLPADTEVTFAPMEALFDGLGGLDLSGVRHMEEVSAGSYSYFADGDILLAKVTPCFENGKKAIAEGLVNGVGFATSEVHVLRPDARRINTRYLRYLLCSEEFRAAGMVSMTGAGGLRRISDHAVLNFRLPLENLSDQGAVADFLDREASRIDQLVEKKQCFVQALEANRKIVTLKFLDIVEAPPMRFTPETYGTGHFPGGWSIQRVKHVVNFMTSGSRGWSDFLADEGELFLQSGNIGRNMEVNLTTAQRIQPQVGAEAKRTMVMPRDVLVCITGGRTGAVGYVTDIDEPAYINQHICLVRARDTIISPKLLAHFLYSEIGQKQFSFFQYGLKQGLGFAQVGEVKVPIPPLALQGRILSDIDRNLSGIDRLIKALQTSIDRLREFRSALITAAVTGQIDVTTWGKRGHTESHLDALEAQVTA